MPKFQPTADRVILEPIEEPKTTKGGLVLPDKHRRETALRRGLVVAAGPGRTLENGQLLPLSVKAGDEVLYNEFEATEIDRGLVVNLVVVAETHIVAKFEKTEG